MNSCKECGKSFENERGLHAHFKKHGLTVAEYYVKHFPKKNLLNGRQMPFKNKKEYFEKDFSYKSQMVEWLNSVDPAEAKKYIKNKFKQRIKDKKLDKMPCHFEVETSELPPINLCKKFYGTYGSFAKSLGLPMTYGKPILSNFFINNHAFKDMEILIDTREQQPLTFKKSKSLKLDFGDYTCGGANYTYTYIDRKSESDFKSTMSVGIERFKKELNRVKEFNSFLYIVVESDLDKITKNNNFSAHKSNLKYIFHNCRNLLREYSSHSQIIFAGSRRGSEYLIPRLIRFGKALWQTDVQYYIDEKKGFS